MKTFVFLVAAGALFLPCNTRAADNPVIVHEWGTFTCLQDEKGQAIGGINVDDEPVPNFVYGSRDGDVVLYSAYGNFGLPPYNPYAGKSGPLPTGDPSVTMRLETPVLYIYPPKGQGPRSVPALDVHVDFHGGFLTQFYPYAASTDFSGQNKITEKSTSSLDWKGVRLGSTEEPVETSDKVWTTPREVSAPLLEVHPMMKDVNGVVHDDAQVEHFLFYRGVGHLNSPIMIQSDLPGYPGKQQMLGRMLINGHTFANPEPIEHLNGGWMVEIRSAGKCAFRAWPGFNARLMSLGHESYFPQVSTAFSNSAFASDNLPKLKASMQDALVKEGLYPDEASAMLRTWELSYFKSPGLRFFYIVPRPWVDEVLSLKITGAPVQVTRVMMGRIELTSDAQRQALARLATGPCPNFVAVKKAALEALEKGHFTDEQRDGFISGERPVSELGVSLPPPVQDYFALGRFRDALIVHEQQVHPSATLAQFIKENQLASDGR